MKPKTKTALALTLMLTAVVAQAQNLPGGTITGVLRTSGGAPASGVRVAAAPVPGAQNGVPIDLALLSLAQTDDMGRYRLENVPPGDYFISAGRVDLPTYYPGTLDAAGRKTVLVASSATITGIDFVVQDASTTLPPQAGFARRGGGPANPALVLQQMQVLQAQMQALQARQAQPIRGRSAAPAPPPPANAAWWTDTAFVARLGLTGDQKQKIENIFEQHRQSIVQGRANLEKEEAALAQMLAAETMEPERNIQAQIERIIQARGELERTNSRMTLEMRQVLTRAQWIELQAGSQFYSATPRGRIQTGGQRGRGVGPATQPGSQP